MVSIKKDPLDEIFLNRKFTDLEKKQQKEIEELRKKPKKTYDQKQTEFVIEELQKKNHEFEREIIWQKRHVKWGLEREEKLHNKIERLNKKFSIPPQAKASGIYEGLQQHDDNNDDLEKVMVESEDDEAKHGGRVMSIKKCVNAVTLSRPLCESGQIDLKSLPSSSVTLSREGNGSENAVAIPSLSESPTDAEYEEIL